MSPYKGNQDPWDWMLSSKKRCKRWGKVVAYLCAMEGRYGSPESDNYNLSFV